MTGSEDLIKLVEKQEEIIERQGEQIDKLAEAVKINTQTIKSLNRKLGENQ